MIDVNYHVITESGEAPPRDYYESLLKMGALGCTDARACASGCFLAGLRNRLVHEYDEIDPLRLHEGLRAAARDIPLYQHCVEKYLPAD